jgi:PAS domain S-box-containing protein
MQRHEFIASLGAAVAVWKRSKKPTALLREAGYLLLGLVSFATVTGLYFWLDVPLVAAAFTYLVVLVLLSLVSNLSSLIVLSFIGVGCLSYFFAPPIYSFRVDYPQDIITISAFVITSFVVNFLVTRVRDANQRLEATNKALRIENVERKRAEQAQRESEDKLRQIIETGPNLLRSGGAEGKKAEVQPGFMAQVQAILNVIPTYTWYAAPRGALTFVNTRTADYLGIPNDHPLRFGIDIGAQWDDWVPMLHPDDQEEARKYWSICMRTGEAGEYSYRVRSAQGDCRWFLTRFEPLRASDGTLLLWVGATLDIEELMRAQEALRESERSLQILVETIPALTWRAKPDGHIDYVNKRLLEYFGSPIEEIIGWGWMEKVHPEDVAFKVQSWLSNLETMASHDATCRFQGADGAYRWFNVRGQPLRDSEGSVQNWYGVLIDIDERKKAEDQLRRSEAYLALSQRLTHTGTWAAANLTTPLYWSDECCRIFGFDPLQGPPKIEEVWQLIHPHERDKVSDEVQRALREKRDYSVAYRIVVSPGTVRHIESTARHLFAAGGELVEIVGTVIDVTERKRAREALRESERRSRSAIDGIAGMVAIMTPNGEIETVNRQVLEYFGRSLDELKNWGTSDAVHPEDLPHVVEMFTRAMVSGLPYGYDQRLRRFDGEYRWFDNRGVPIRDDSGRIERWYVLMTDIEDRTRALAQLEQMQSDFAHVNRVSMMGELAASLSHEITQPIGSARNNARAAINFLEMQPPDLSEVREALGCVVGDTDRAGDIIDRIRDHIKKTPPRKQQFDLNEAINEVIVLGRSAIIKNGVSVQTRLSGGLFPILGDRVQLQQVVLNLILNAAEAMGSVEAEPRELLISTEQHHTGVLVGVRDSGPGIDPAHLERVFEAFYTTKSRGVGMGLSICRSIIDAHGGRLWAEANEPRGTIFQFTLPAVRLGS